MVLFDELPMYCVMAISLIVAKNKGTLFWEGVIQFLSGTLFNGL